MSPAAFLDEAVEKSCKLVNRESRGPGDLDNAMRRIETRYGVPYATLWALRYRKPKEITVSAYLRVVQAYEAFRAEQYSRMEHERSITEAKSRFTSRLVGAADALVGETDGGS